MTAQALSHRALAFVDLETTGATATADRITEIGIVEVDEEGVREWSRLVNPGTPIPYFIQRLTGITDEMVRDAPTFAELAGEVLERLKGRLFIAHNARFDYGFLKSEMRRAGHDFRATVLCTVKLSRRLYPQHHRHNLDILVERHGLKVQGRHRALADAQLIHQFWQQIRYSQPEEALSALVDELTALPALPEQLDPAIVEDLPEAPGVYLCYGESGQALYIGRAKDIKKRVLARLAGDKASATKGSLARQVRRIDWIVTAGEIGAQLKEAALIKQLRPTLNPAPRGNDEGCVISLNDRDGSISPEILLMCDLDPGRLDNCYGPYKSAAEASGVLAQLARVRSPLGLVQTLARQRLKPWPYAGPAAIREGEELHVVDDWRYLGTASSDDELWSLLEQSRPAIDLGTYRILAKVADRLVPLPGSR